jgi:hypothetical protein
MPASVKVDGMTTAATAIYGTKGKNRAENSRGRLRKLNSIPSTTPANMTPHNSTSLSKISLTIFN